MRQIVRRGPAVVGSQQHLAVRPRRPAPTATARLLPTTAARTSRRSVRSLLTTITAVTRNRPTTTIAAIRSRAHTIRLLPVLIRRRELIPHRAAAIQPRLAPTPHPAAAAATVAMVRAIAVVSAAVGVAVEAAEVTAVTVEGAAAHDAVLGAAEARRPVGGP